MANQIWSRLDAVARNLWWSWNPDAQALFASMDPAHWKIPAAFSFKM